MFGNSKYDIEKVNNYLFSEKYDQLISYLKSCSRIGDPRAKIKLADLYYEGEIITKDINRAAKLYHDGAAQLFLIMSQNEETIKRQEKDLEKNRDLEKKLDETQAIIVKQTNVRTEEMKALIRAESDKNIKTTKEESGRIIETTKEESGRIIETTKAESDRIIETICHSVSSIIKVQKKQFSVSLQRKDDMEPDEKESAFIHETAREISDCVIKHRQQSDTIRSKLEDHFGEYWKRLDKYSQNSLISAEIMLKVLESSKLPDWSGIIISATSALENELRCRLFEPYLEFLINTCGSPSVDTWPDSMLQKRGGQLYKGKGSQIFLYGCFAVYFGSPKG